MRRAGVLVVSVLLTLLTGCEPGDGDATASPTSTVPIRMAHTDVLDLVEAADKAVKQRGTALFGLSGGKSPKPFGAGRLAYREENFDVLVRTLRRKKNLEYRAIGDALFVQPAGKLVSIARGMPWLKLPATSANPLSHILSPAMIKAPSTVDPTQTFDFLVAAGTIAGSERATLGDAEVTRYEIDLDIARLAEHIKLSSPGQSRQPLVTALRALVDRGTTTANATLLLDRHDLPRRIRLLNLSALPKRGPAAGPGLPVITVNYRKWGKPPVVAPPPADAIATVPG